MIHLRLLDKTTFRQINEFTCTIDRCPWDDIRVWQTFAHVTITVMHDA